MSTKFDRRQYLKRKLNIFQIKYILLDHMGQAYDRNSIYRKKIKSAEYS